MGYGSVHTQHSTSVLLCRVHGQGPGAKERGALYAAGRCGNAEMQEKDELPGGVELMEQGETQRRTGKRLKELPSEDRIVLSCLSEGALKMTFCTSEYVSLRLISLMPSSQVRNSTTGSAKGRGG